MDQQQGHSTTWVSGAAAIDISACGSLGTAGATYNLTTDVGTCAGACLTVAADNITINLRGFDITSFCGGTNGITDGGVARTGTSVNGAPPAGSPAGTPNGGVFGWSGTGIDLAASSKSTVRNIES